MVLSSTARKFLAAIWFAACGFLVTAIFFWHPPIAFRALALYVLLPAISAGIAGYIWGGAILDRSKTKSYGDSLLRGAGVTAGAFTIFAALFACALPLVERGWSMHQVGGIFLMTMTLGLLMVGSLVLIAGMLGGGILYMLGLISIA